jgi:hypothetical protein
MNVRDWHGFLQQGAGKEIAIAQLSLTMTNHLGALSDRVYLHHDYATKAVEKHKIWVGDLSLIFEAIDYGTAIADRPLHITFLWDSRQKGWFQVTVKRAFESRRVYICTFYKTSLKEVNRKVKRYPVLRK